MTASALAHGYQLQETRRVRFRTQPEPAEGPPANDGPTPERAPGEGVSADDPAEGADSIPGPNEGSPDGAGDRAS